VSTAIVVPGNGAVSRDGVYRVSKRCLGLVGRAEALAVELEPQAVLFTGAGRSGSPSEAEQMRAAWQGPPVELVVEPSARNTAENAARTLPLLLERGIDRAVVVSARLHGFRVRFFFSRVYGTHGVETAFVSVGRVPSPREVGWELVALPFRRRHLHAAENELGRTT
jgi:uncharacterized SAM-binding protein YcdF (DUF218 family)